MLFRSLFMIHHSDRRVLLVLLLLAVVVTGVLLWNDNAPVPSQQAMTGEATHDSLALPGHRQRGKGGVTHADVAGNRPGAGTYADGYEQREAETFCFDPNTADSATLCRLGLSRWQVNDILRYRARGGVYMQATEFARVYRLTKEQYARLAPYIRIADRFRPAAELLPASAQKRANTRTDSTLTAKRPMKLRVGQQIALESCDTTQLKSVPGIGSYWAGRIVDYRERLGGYYDLSQLEELQGFPAEALPYLYLENGGKDTRRMNVNTLTLNQLHKHPYISFRQARDIIDYRRRHGRIDNLAQLALLPSFSPDDIERLSHYVEY